MIIACPYESLKTSWVGEIFSTLFFCRFSERERHRFLPGHTPTGLPRPDESFGAQSLLHQGKGPLMFLQLTGATDDFPKGVCGPKQVRGQLILTLSQDQIR